LLYNIIMKDIRSIKLKLDGDVSKFETFSQPFLDACNWFSEILYNQNFFSEKQVIESPNSYAKEYYSTLREKFKLPSQLSLSIFRLVCTEYKSMISNNEFELAKFKKPTMPICWKRDFNVSNKFGLTIWKTPFKYQSINFQIPLETYKDSKLKKVKNRWFLILSYEIDVPEPKTEGCFLGVDSGINNLFVAKATNSNKTLFVSGKEFNHKRERIRELRRKVASVGSRSAYRLLKRLSGKEKSVTQNFVHSASKKLVTFALSQNAKTIVMEDLTHIRKRTKEKNHELNGQRNRWPFEFVQFCIGYKGRAVGLSFEYVFPAYTSQMCPICGHIHEDNRHGNVFKCLKCGYTDHADRIGSINIPAAFLCPGRALDKGAVCQPAYSSVKSRVCFANEEISPLQASAFRRG